MNSNERASLGETRQLLRELASLGDVKAPSSIIPGVLGRVGLTDVYFSLQSPIGPLFVAYNDLGISAVMPAEDPARFEEAFRARFGRTAHRADRPPAALARAIEARLSGRQPRDLHFDLRGLSEFERAVLLKALEIPRGEVRPYAWIAAEIEHPRAVRAVGTALGRNPIPLLIPCHRVVRSDGRTGNYVFGAEAKRALLQAEGIQPALLEELASEGLRYYGSNTTRIFCYPTCQHAKRISEGHRVPFKSSAEAVAAGYRPCKVCRPAMAGG
jgi:O-6-methylguanine DNA methyltransferase